MIPYGPNEQNVATTIPGMFGMETQIKTTPVTAAENILTMFTEKTPYWVPMVSDTIMMVPPLYENNLGRGGPDGAVDVFGIEWQWVADVGGAMEKPGPPLMTDANDWKEIIKFPDIDSWDWAKAAAELPLDSRLASTAFLNNGFWFERMISFMQFMNAAIAVIDEDQIPAIHEMFGAMTDFGMKVMDKFFDYWPNLTSITIHDDWGSQQSPFFSQETAESLFLPYMKKFVDHIHSKGRFCILHSCGHVETRVETFIKAGFDAWDPQPMNDTQELWEKYGDKIIIAVNPDPFDPATTSEEEQRQHARDFADKFCVPGKPLTLGFYSMETTTPAFLDELYTQSRILYNERSK
jgi:hypothetical protein